MTPEKILEVVAKYERYLAEMGLEPDEGCRYVTTSGAAIGGSGRRAHLGYMIGEIRTFVADNRIDKAFRWLGFMQGVLWADGYFTVEQMGRHNTADEKTA